MLVVQERDGNNLALVSYTRGNDLSGSRQGAGGIGGLLARTDMPSTLDARPSTAIHAYFHSDGNGNITALVDTNGFIVARYQYDPYGNLLGMSGPLAEANTYRFSSKEWHANSGLYYYGFRYYEPHLQRWLSRDPLAELGGINLFAYVFNSPIHLLDPFGLSSCDDLVNRLMQTLEDHPDQEEFGDFLYEHRYDFNMPDGTGFKERLTKGGQDGAAGRHIAAGAGLTVSSPNFAGPIATRLQSARDFTEGIIGSKPWAESVAERRDNTVSRRVGQAFVDYFGGQCGIVGDCAAKNKVRQRLLDLLCD
jgi:RHS repeat-associated protein